MWKSPEHLGIQKEFHVMICYLKPKKFFKSSTRRKSVGWTLLQKERWNSNIFLYRETRLRLPSKDIATLSYQCPKQQDKERRQTLQQTRYKQLARDAD